MCGGTNLTKIFVNNDAEVTEVSQKEEESYAQEWFTRFVPSDKRQKAIDSYCFDKDGYSGYLWHVFSYKIMECVEGA